VSEASETLRYAVRLPIVGYYLSQLAAMLALLTLVPLSVSLYWGDLTVAFVYVGIIALLGLLGFQGLGRPPPGRIQTNEAVVVVGLAFVLAPLLMCLPVAATGIGFVDALFEAVSGVTTTGLSTLASVEGHTPSFLFSRAWMQWYGGLGIAVLSVAFLLGRHAAARRLVETTQGEGLATTARRYARQVLIVYALLTAVGTLLVWVLLGDGFLAVVHVLAAVSTGGFAPADASLAAVPLPAAWALLGFAAVGACPLVLWYGLLGNDRSQLWKDPEVRALVVAVLVVTGLLALCLHAGSGLDWGDALRQGALLGVSAQTTTGFSTLDVGSLDPAAKLALIGAMALGGCSGSTAGGIKLLRLLVIVRLAQFWLQRSAMPPHAALRPRLAGNVLEPADIERASLVILLYLVVAVVAWAAFIGYGHAPLNALFEVVSAVGTVGLSTGLTGPELETPLKLLLCVVMLLGRLEIFALLVLVYPPTWFGRRTTI
jgi:trk system potassium uptake protein TrkH